MNRPRRPVKVQAGPKRAKPDTSNKLTSESPTFTRNEWLETLSRVKADQPKRYAREVSAGLQVTVDNYERLKAEHEQRMPARREGRREVSGAARIVQLRHGSERVVDRRGTRAATPGGSFPEGRN